ncbi:hypothetical protein GH721_13305 [Kriegella sp. EG-1]|nr:hypothetical protein [Flavobacteriaceae bacterium EG-1]
MAQKSDTKQALYTFFDSIISIENSEIHNGLIYKEKHRVKSKKSKFFPEPDFVTGSIIFNNQPYNNLQLKYNVYDDELLFQVKKKYGGDILQLDKHLVQGFNIDNHVFIKLYDKKLGQNYFEVISKKSALTLLTKHKKSIHEILNKKLVFYEFEDVNNEYYIAYNDSLYYIKNLNDFAQLFPDFKIEITNYYKGLESHLNLESKLKKLIAHFDPILTSTSTKI